MSAETIELIKILRDETQSKAVYDRCGAELKRISAQPNWGAHNKRVEAQAAPYSSLFLR